MTKKKLDALSNDELINLFEAAAREQGDAVPMSEIRKANAAYDRREVVYQQLASRGPEARRQLARLLDHTDPAVRLYTAKRLRDIFPERVKAILEHIVKFEDSAFALAAGMSLDHLES